MVELITLSDVSKLLTEEVLREVLRSSMGEPDVEMTSYSVTRACPLGEGFLSFVYKATISGVAGGLPTSKSFFIKGLPSRSAWRKTFRSVQFFKNEVAFFNEVLPPMLSFEKKYNVKESIQKYIPRCYKAVSDGQNDYLILQDLSKLGFVPFGNQTGLAYDQINGCIELLAKFHAISFAMKRLEPRVFEKISRSIGETYYKVENKTWYWNYHRNLCKCGLQNVAMQIPEDSRYFQKFENVTDENVYDRICEGVKPKEPFSVLCHGDAWTPNFLTNSSMGTTRMVDFQLVRYASPITDLIYIIYATTTKRTRDQHFEDLLKNYHKTIHGYLANLDLDMNEIYPYAVFRTELKKYGRLGLEMCLSTVPLSMAEPGSCVDLSVVLNAEEAVPLEMVWKVGKIKSEEGRQRLTDLLIDAVDQGFV